MSVTSNRSIEITLAGDVDANLSYQAEENLDDAVNFIEARWSKKRLIQELVSRIFS